MLIMRFISLPGKPPSNLWLPDKGLGTLAILFMVFPLGFKLMAFF